MTVSRVILRTHGGLWVIKPLRFFELMLVGDCLPQRIERGPAPSKTAFDKKRNDVALECNLGAPAASLTEERG